MLFSLSTIGAIRYTFLPIGSCIKVFTTSRPVFRLTSCPLTGE